MCPTTLRGLWTQSCFGRPSTKRRVKCREHVPGT
jgi:hypothetical protein